MQQVVDKKEIIEKVNELNTLAYNSRYIDPGMSIEDSTKALELSEKINFKQGEYAARMSIAFANFILSKDYPILKQLTEAYQYFKETKSIPEYPILLNYLGNVYDNYGEYQKGLTLCHEGLKYAQDYKLKEVESDLLSTIGLIMSRICDFTGAIESYKKSYEIRNELGNHAAMASSLNLMARIYALSDQYELSEQYYLQAITLRIGIKETGALPWSYIGLASLYEKKKDFENAILYYNRSLEQNKSNIDKRCSLHCYLGLSRILIEMHELNKSKEYIDKTLQIAQELNANPILYEGYEILSKYYSLNGDIEKAFESFKKFHDIRESVLNAQTHSMLKNQQLSFEIEQVQKDAEIHHLRNIELKSAYETLEKRTHELINSIDYAKNIQIAMLPPLDYFNSLFPDSFIYYNPKAIVSGDFYWCYSDGTRSYVAAGDCTGHGVPGGFMSILGLSLLNEIMSSTKVLTVESILSELRNKIISSLRQSMTGESLKDGMDIALCCIDKKKNSIEFAGAFNPIYIIENSKLTEIKGDRMPIGIFDDTVHQFTKHIIEIVKGMRIYMFSDGFIDQFGGSDGKKLKAARFKDLILKISSEPMMDQRTLLDNALTEWFQGNEQVDDILVMGIRF